MNLIEQIKVNDVSIDGYQGTYYSESPEWVKVILDSEDKVLAGIKEDGTVEWSAGVPTPIREHIEQTVTELHIENKVDKEYGKSLIDSSVADSMSFDDNPEFLTIITDYEDKVLEGIQADGTKVIGGDLNVGGSTSINSDVTVKGSVTIDGTSYKVIENPEYVWAIIDNDDKILSGIKTDGKFVADIDGIDEKIQEAINQIQTIIDEAQASIDEKIAAIDEKFDFISWIEDPEGRSEITTDKDNRVLSYRTPDGIKVENGGLKTNHLELEGEAPSDLAAALDALGYMANNPTDWSDSEFVEIPIPKVCAVVNIEVDGQAEAKGVDIPTHIQFWDKSGNYFRKPIELNA